MKQRINRSTGPVALAVVFAGSVAAVAAAIEPPPEPDVKPVISTVRAEDTDGDGIEDRLLSRVRAAEDQLRQAATEAEEAAARARLDAVVEVELVFSRQITQPEIDAFLAAGGEITYVFRAVSYGWIGSLRLGDVETVAADLAGGLAFMVGEKPVQRHLDEATRTGRVRPIWASGFAGVGAGIDGDPDITIAILDSGLDESHPDLAGRREGWIDHLGESAVTAIDHRQHGTRVAGIAVGSGAAHGSASATLEWTQSGRMIVTVPAGAFFANPVHIVGSTTLTSSAVFAGMGPTDLFGASAPDGGSWTDLSAATTGGSPLGPETNAFAGAAGSRYGPRLVQGPDGPDGDSDPDFPVDYFAVASTLTGYPAGGDGFNTFRGVCPECQWYGEKIVPNSGGGIFFHMNEGLDHIVTNRMANDIKVANVSLGGVGDPGLNSPTRDKVNTAVANGIFVAISAGNDGAGTGGPNVVDDPGRASLAMTVGATNDVNQLTDYSSSGFTGPGANEDYKPDVVAPGGSAGHYSGILTADSNTSDGDSSSALIADQQPDDYSNVEGSSMAAPFVAGAAGLVIDAMQQAGTSWSFASSVHPLFVKMILSATATETNLGRESAGFDPELNRNAAGSGDSTGWPARKDRFEGYGLINPDAAVEAVLLSSDAMIVLETDSFPGTLGGRRAWARNVPLLSGYPVDCDLELETTLDADMYLFSETSDAKGNPLLAHASASATTAALGDGLMGAVDENLSFTPSTTETGYLVVKRVAGSGVFELTCTGLPVELTSFSIE